MENHASWRTTPRVGEVLQLGRRVSLVVCARRHRLPLRNRLPPHHGTAAAGAFSGLTTLFARSPKNSNGFFATIHTTERESCNLRVPSYLHIGRTP